MSNIIFVKVPESYVVKLDGKVVGVIKGAHVPGIGGWQYWPKGSKSPSLVFYNLADCQNSLKE